MPPIKQIGAVGPKKAPREQVTVRLDELLERLPTTEGAKLGDQLFARVARHLEGEGQLDPFMPLKNPPKDKLGKALAKAYQEHFVNAFHARSELPGVLANMLLEFTAAKRGPVDLAGVEKKFGPELRGWIEQLARVPPNAQSSPIADRIAYDSLADYQRSQVLNLAPTIAPQLEALAWTLRTYARPKELEGFQFLGLQHLFASSVQLFDGLNKLGVKPEDSRLIGKVYSTNFRVAGELEAKGMIVDPRSRDLGHETNFGKAMGESIEYQLTRIIERLPQPKMTVHDQDGMHYVWAEPPKPMALLIDDGAEAIKMLHEKFPQWAPFFACVEQTRRGARIAHELADAGKLKCAVVNVAESWAKLERESPMIGQSVVAEVERKLDRIERAGIPRAKEATIIGYGSVGQRVAQALMARGITVHVYDKDPSRLKDLPAGLIAHTDKQEALTHGAVTISCVGSRTLYPEDYDSLPNGAVLVNAASADDELGPQDLLPYQKPIAHLDNNREGWSVFLGKPISIGHPEAEAHSDTVVKLDSGKELLLASNGFVVNMTGERDPIPPRFIQLTRALLLMGAMTATRAEKPGLIEVPEDWQKALVAQIESELKTRGESLQKPLWDAVVDAPAPPPPREAIEAVRREKEEEARKAAEEAKARRLPPPPPPPDAPPVGMPVKTSERQSEGKVFGYALGRAFNRDSFAWSVAEAMEMPDHEMTVEAWALYHATQAANRANGWHLAVKLNPDTTGRATPAQLTAPPANAARAAKERDATVFEAYFGYHLRGLAGYALQSRLKAPPSPEQLADAMKKTARLGEMDLQPYIDFLKASGDAEDAKLAAALAAPSPP